MTTDGGKTDLFRLRNPNGMEVCITNYGARVVSLLAPDREGRLEDVVCGFDKIADYVRQSQNYGATVGRYLGRILNAHLLIDGETYRLQANHPDGHTAHGGSPNFGARLWTVRKYSDSSLTLSYLSPDGENGFPGNLAVSVTYTLTSDNELDIQYEATTDKPTVINLSHHSFFNISGRLDGSIEDQVLQVNASYFTPYDRKKCVTGEKWPVHDTPFDFRLPRSIGERINEPYAQLKITNGYDHAFVLDTQGSDARLAASVCDTSSGRIMEVYTTEPGLHIYTGNGLKGTMKGKRGIAYPFRGAVCFETCHFQDSPNKLQFPSTALYPGEVYRSRTIYKFRTAK